MNKIQNTYVQSIMHVKKYKIVQRNRSLHWEFSVNPADILLLDLSCSDLLLHFPRLLWIPSEKKETRGESVQPVDRAQVLEAVLLGQDEHHGVVAVATARMNLKKNQDRNRIV